MVTLCGYLGCPRPATRRLLAKYARLPWFGCDEHHPAMTSALYVGQSNVSAAEVTVTKL